MELIRLRNILNTYSDEELLNMNLWVTSRYGLKAIVVEEDNIILTPNFKEFRFEEPSLDEIFENDKEIGIKL